MAFVRISKTACIVTCLATIVLTGCNPPTETIPRLKKRDRTAGSTSSGLSGSGISIGSGVTWGSGITGSGITISGSGITGSRSGITLPHGGIDFKQQFREMRGSGITVPKNRLNMDVQPSIQPDLQRDWNPTKVIPVAYRTVRPQTGEKKKGDASDADSEVKLKLVDHAQLLDSIQKRRGKIVVLDVWSTSCLPCMREFPNLVKLSERYTKDVACLSLNVDYIGLKKKPANSYKPRAAKFLAAQKTKFENFLSTEADETIREKLKISSIPAILIYDRSGKLVHRLGEDNSVGDGLSYEADVLPKVEKLMAVPQK